MALYLGCLFGFNPVVTIGSRSAGDRSSKSSLVWRTWRLFVNVGRRYATDGVDAVALVRIQTRDELDVY